MFSRYIRLTALLLCACLLTACAAPAKESPAPEATETVTEESCVSEQPEVTPEATPEPTPEPWLEYAVNSPELAEELVRAEIAKMQEMGLLSEKLYISEGEADRVMFFDQPEFLDRSGRPYFSVSWYGDSWYGNNWEGENLYSICANLDVQSGKIMYMSIEAAADENAPVSFEVPETSYDEERNESVETGAMWLYHQNFYDIFDEGMTVERFGTLLNEYWGFPGWKIAGGGAFNPATPLEDISGGTTGNRYVPLKFEGDEENKHMYLQISEFPGRVCLIFGTDHSHG